MQCNRERILAIGAIIVMVSVVLAGAGQVPTLEAAEQITGPLLAQGPDAQISMSCTFTASVNIRLRSGPGIDYAMVGYLTSGSSRTVIGQATGLDGYVWWQIDTDTYLRSDLGESDCDAVCGNDVCEYGETVDSCAADCTGVASAVSSASCLVSSCASCYETVDCYPDCNQCSCTRNEFGCIECYCDYPATSGAAAVLPDTPVGGTTSTTSTDSGVATGTGCVFASCEECYAAYPCTDGECTQFTCDFNEYGCPVCTTAP